MVQKIILLVEIFQQKRMFLDLSPYLHWGEISPFEVWQSANIK